MDNVCKVFQAVNEELFPDGRQRPLGQSAGGHNNPLPPLQQENNDNADDSEFDTDNSGTDEEPAEDNTDDDDAENSSDSETDDEVSNAFSDSDDMADPGAAAAAGGGAGRTKSIIPTFAGEGNNIFEISTLTQEFIDSFLGYCQHARITHDRRLENLDQCLTGVAKKWYRTETKFVGDFTNWNAFEAKFADCFGIELTLDARGTEAKSCTSGMASSAATSSTVAVSTSTRSASRQSRPSPEQCPPATHATPEMTVRPARRRSRGSPTPCHRENASTSSSADWRRRCGRKSKSYPKASHSMKFARLFTTLRTPPQSPRRTPHSQ